MTNEQKPPQPRLSDPLKTALIGAAATIAVALISGMFTLLGRTPPTAQSERQSAAVQATVDITSTIAASLPITDSGLRFATQVTLDGIAIDPGTSFPSDIKQVYAVFRPDRVPPGLRVNHQSPTAQNYYAYLEAINGQAPLSVGWKWFYGGKLVNKYETKTQSSYFWLSLQNLGGQGLFEGLIGSAGDYEVYITIAGNPVLRTQLHIQP